MTESTSNVTARCVSREYLIPTFCALVFGIIPGMAQEGFYLRLIPGRDATASRLLIDLSDFYTAPLDNDWLVSSGVNLQQLPKGIQTLAGVQFDVRGIVQLASTELLLQSTLSDQEKTKQYPRAVKGIPVKLAARRIHFLQASAWAPVTATKSVSTLSTSRTARRVRSRFSTIVR